MTESGQIRRWHHCEQITVVAVDRILQAAASAIAQKKQFSIVLAGGNTPKAVYEKLACAATDWSCWQIYFGDERCLPADHPERNSKMALASWLSRVPLPGKNIHVIPAELGPEKGAERYCEILEKQGDFDLVLLGLGEDGHTASLFPGKNWGADADSPAAIAVFDAPKPPPERISLSASRLSQARAVIFLVSGAGKKEAVRAWQADEVIPAAGVTPECGVDIYLDF